ncbi:DUF699-domain-containing protein [Dendrothele bispora CBS 962.96]|uniref:RNA cytidine acetyltransferase n=1 Tax=Dendrothele bispora (strain CBS 962.96) TaxID=1314807 RepID=A0A4S8MDN7_DENBC|nr:DUF699-domain-containing protein [Dendrothele bispora CBS 962.96]
MRKQLDPRIPTLINNNVKQNHRSFIVLVGDKGRDQIVNLHFLLSQARVSARPSVLWCYKKDLGFTTHRKKREAKIKRDVKRGIREPNEQNPFEIFVTVTDIRYTYYKESHKILGHTYGMLVLQDFEALTPNLLARTVETVEGGGLIVLLLKTMSSLRQLYTMTMDVHSRYRTESSGAVVARFNERFILSLGGCKDCLVLDDELNVLPISKGKDITPYEPDASSSLSPDEIKLKELKSSLEDIKPAGPLIALTKTLDQAHVLLSFIDSVASSTSNPSRSLSTTHTLTAARGRGKSAALGLAIAGAIASGYANIFVTSPTPDNLKTLFDFLFKGLDALGYEEHLDYDILQATSDELSTAGGEWGSSTTTSNTAAAGAGGGGDSSVKLRPIVRVNIFRNQTHRQTIQYIHPADAHVLGQAELVVIDEAAAIPLPLVRNLLGPYAIWMASTINGYEGTGRSLSLKLIEGLRESSGQGGIGGKDPGVAGKEAESSTKPKTNSKTPSASSSSTRTLTELKLTTPIRYSAGDQIELWLNKLLCLDATLPSTSTRFSIGTPHPSLCTLYHVNRDTLFSYHPASEAFLQRMMALYVSSHYKNQPNDLQLMSDAPAHELFVLLPPLNPGNKDSEQNTETETDVLPTPLAVLQIAYEGRLAKSSILEGLSRGLRAGGDMIPWLVAQQYQEGRFAELSGARVVRVAVDPELANMGYGSRALHALNAYYSGEYFNLDEQEKGEEEYPDPRKVDETTSLLTDKPTVRAPGAMPPLLQRLSERKPEQLDYLGVSYGLTPQLLRFWKRLGYVPLYIRHTPSDLTGEHTCVMVRGLNTSTEGELEWLGEFGVDFRTRFLTLLSFPKFRDFGSVMGLSVLEAVNNHVVIRKVDERGGVKALTPTLLPTILTPFDLKRLESYGNNMLDYHVILDLMPIVASLFFQRKLTRSSSSNSVSVEEDGNDPSSANISNRNISLSAVQSAILLGMGLQRKTVEDMEVELSLPVSQILALLVKIVRKVTKKLVDVQKEGIVAREMSVAPLPSTSRMELGSGTGSSSWKPVQKSTEEELEAAGEEEKEAMKKRARQREMINALDLRKYAIDDAATDWSTAESQVARIVQGREKAQTVVSVRSMTAGQKRKAADDKDDRKKVEDGGEGKKQTRRSGKKAKR